MQVVEMPMRRGDSAGAAFADRRRMPREAVKARGLVSIQVPGEEAEGQMVDVFDLNLSGVGFRSPVPFDVEAMHHILVMAGPLRLSSRLKVVSCRACHTGGFEIGAQFC